MKTYKIHLIRCSYTQGTLEGRYIGHTDEDLCEDGIECINDMLNEFTYPDAEVVFTSPLKRCIQTSNYIYPDKEPVKMDSLIEYNFGEFEGRNADELAPYSEFAEWLKGGADFAPPHGESSRQFAARVCEGFAKLVDGMLKSGVSKTAVITHGGVIMTILSAFGLPEAPMHEWKMPPAGGYTLNVIPSMWMKSQKLEIFAEIPEEHDDDDCDDDYEW